jgi:hypothetical protein
MLIVPAVNTDAMYELAAAVSSKHDLQRFLEYLAEDYDSNGEVWVNHSIPGFLRAFACCLQRAERITAAGGELSDGAQLVSWQHVARLLLASSVARVRQHNRTAATRDGEAEEPYYPPPTTVD